MKKYLIFSATFIILFSLSQVLTGVILTALYTHDINDAWNASASLSQETIIRSSYHSFWITLLVALLSASIAYFISNKFMNTNMNR